MVAIQSQELTRNTHGGNASGRRLLSAMAGMILLLAPDLGAQTATTSTAPLPDPAAASGMTSGLPGVSPQRQAEMMVIRARAQAARPEAERAAMERSADDALAQKSQDQLLQETREMKQMKEQAARQLEHQRAANAYRAVTAGELNTWSDNAGRVKVERGVPPEIMASLPPEDEEPIVEEEKSGFNPFKLPKKAAGAATGAASAVVGAAKKGVSWVPKIGKDEEVETGITATPRVSENASDMGEKKGFFKNFGKRDEEPSPTAIDPAETGEKTGLVRGLTSRIPFVGGKDKTDASPEMAPAPAPAPNPVSDPIAGPVANQAPAPEPVDDGFFKKIPLIGGSKKSEDSVVAVANAATDSPPSVPTEAEKPGMLGGIAGLVGRAVPGGKDRSTGGDGPIDASLFPQEGDPEKLMADQTAGRKKLLKLPELPSISAPSLPNIAAAEKKAPMPDRSITPVHSGGNANYVVSRDGAQFMRYGAGPLGSEAMSLRSGTVVTKTKVGDEWSTILLADGSTGIIRNGDLKPASGGAVPSSLAGPVAPKPAATRDSSPPALGGGGLANVSSATGGGLSPVRITRTVSATGAGVEGSAGGGIPGPAPTVPESSLTDTTGGQAIPPPTALLPPAP